MEERIEQFLQERKKEMKRMRFGELERRYNEVSIAAQTLENNGMKEECYVCLRLTLIYLCEMKDRLEEAIEKWG